MDKIYTVKNLLYGGVARADSVNNTAGGKGIHVANVITNIGEECLLTGFVGGKTGEFIQKRLNERKIKHEFVCVETETRTCINIMTPDGKQTEILEPGSFIEQAQQQLFLRKYKQLLQRAEVVVASGSLPVNVSSDFYGVLGSLANAAGKKFLLDTSGDALQKSIFCKPYLVKPNLVEAEKFTGCSIKDVYTAAKAVHTLQRNVTVPVISMGKDGAVISYENNVYHVLPPQIPLVNAVGSGDAFMAGMAIGFYRKDSIENIIRLACACGTANAMEAESGCVKKANVEKLLEKIVIKKLNI